MNIRIIFPVLFLLVLVTSIGNITAQEDALTSNEAKPSVQIIQGEKCRGVLRRVWKNFYNF